MKLSRMNKKIIKFSIVLILLIMIGGCLKSNTINLTSDDYNEIEKYLSDEIFRESNNGKTFGTFEILGLDNNEIYIWALIMNYDKGKNELAGGWSVPLVLMVQRVNGNLEILGFHAPGDGNLYSEDVKKLFPKHLHQRILEYPSSGRVEELKKKLETRAKEWINTQE